MNRRLKLLVNSPLWSALLIRHLLPPLLAAAPRRPGRILAIGCGRGDSTSLLRRHFPDAAITATDYDAIQIELARRRLPPGTAELDRADATALPYASDSFDAVFEFNSLHHISDWRLALSELSRVLRSGGHLTVMDETARFFNPLFRWFDEPESLFTREDLILAAADLGLLPLKDVGSRSIIKIVFHKK